VNLERYLKFIKIIVNALNTKKGANSERKWFQKVDNLLYQLLIISELYSNLA
jgi:hypothetical protein